MTVVTRQDQGACTILTLNRPERLNAMNDPLLDALDRHLDDLERSGPPVIVLTGAGRAFCVGSDMKEHGADPDKRVMRMHDFVLRMSCYPKISIAALHGHVLGGGIELALACTFRVAAPDARLGLPEIKLSLMPAYGATQTLPRLIGEARALEMMLTGEPVDAPAAKSYGLVTALAADQHALLPTATGLAERCAGLSQTAQRAIRRAVHDGAGLPLRDALAIERRLVKEVAESPEALAGIEAFARRSSARP